MDRLRITTDVDDTLSLFCTLAIHQATGSILEFPKFKTNNALLEYLLLWFEQKDLFNGEERNNIRSLVAISSSEDSNSLLEEVKGYVLKKK